MPWVAILNGLLQIVNLVAGYVKDKQLIDAGKAEAIVAGMSHVSAMVEDAAKGAAGVQFDTDWTQRMRDKYRKP